MLPNKKDFTELTDKEWDRCFAVNVRGAWLCARAVISAMKRQGRGKPTASKRLLKICRGSASWSGSLLPRERSWTAPSSRSRASSWSASLAIGHGRHVR